MSGALPFPTSDNRSLISAGDLALQGGSYSYAYARDAHSQDTAHRQPSSSHSPHSTDGGHAPLPRTAHDLPFVVPGQAPLLVNGPLGASSDQERDTHASQGYQQPSLPYRDQYAQLHPGNMYSSSEDSALSAYPSRSYDAVQSDSRSAVSHSSLSRSPPAQADPLSTAHRSEATASKPSAKRREKPRIELAPDQPLTTQGKPRARVYVACVQW